MNLRLKSVLSVLLAVAAASAAADEARPKRRPDVLIVGDAGGPAGALRPAADRPVHYVLLGGTMRNLGDELPHLRLFGATDVARELRQVLATQNFLEAAPGGPAPEIAILYSWGSANLVWLAPEDYLAPLAQGEFESDPQNLVFNHREINQLIGGPKADRRLLSWWDAEKLTEAYRNDRIYVEIAALDLAAAARKERKLLWRTRISLDWRDLKDDSLGLMLASAAPYFGRETERGVFVDDNLRRKTEVTIGEAEVVKEEAKPTERR